MESTKGYLFKTEKAAKTAVNLINEGEGLPNNGYTTKTYCEPIEVVGGWAILHDEVTQKYLGQPVDIVLPTPEPIG
jgi:hypothetical protein